MKKYLVNVTYKLYVEADDARHAARKVHRALAADALDSVISVAVGEIIPLPDGYPAPEQVT